MLRFGLFGTGHWAIETHGKALHAHPDAELVGVWGRNPERASALAERYGVPAYADVDALIEQCEAVAVALPPDVQADIAVRAASAGRHLLLDKPLALSVADADRVVAAAEESGVASVVFFTQRFQPNVTAFLAATAAAGGGSTAGPPPSPRSSRTAARTAARCGAGSTARSGTSPRTRSPSSCPCWAG